jgi:hypothetical protein
MFLSCRYLAVGDKGGPYLSKLKGTATKLALLDSSDAASASGGGGARARRGGRASGGGGTAVEELSGEAAIMKRFPFLNLRAVAAAATGSIAGSRSDGGNAITAADEEGIKDCLPSSYMNGGGSSGGIGNGHGDDEAKDDGAPSGQLGGFFEMGGAVTLPLPPVSPSTSSSSSSSSFSSS